MAYVVLGAFVLLVVGAAWMSRRARAPSVSGCCAPADPRHDPRMRDAFAGDSEDPTGALEPTPPSKHPGDE